MLYTVFFNSLQVILTLILELMQTQGLLKQK